MITAWPLVSVFTGFPAGVVSVTAFAVTVRFKRAGGFAAGGTVATSPTVNDPFI